MPPYSFASILFPLEALLAGDAHSDERVAGHLELPDSEEARGAGPRQTDSKLPGGDEVQQALAAARAFTPLAPPPLLPGTEPHLGQSHRLKAYHELMYLARATRKKQREPIYADFGEKVLEGRVPTRVIYSAWLHSSSRARKIRDSSIARFRAGKLLSLWRPRSNCRSRSPRCELSRPMKLHELKLLVLSVPGPSV